MPSPRVVLVAIALIFVAATSHATLTLSPDGQTVQDDIQGVTWLANADLAASTNPAYLFNVSRCSSTQMTDCVNTSGSMDYQAAKDWVAGMNKAGYLGHDNWQLPTTPAVAAGCNGTGAQNNGFAFNCMGSAMGSLYYNKASLNLAAPNSAVPVARNTVSRFTNLQPNLYWSGTNVTNPNGTPSNGYFTFSFATGWSGSNVGDSSKTGAITGNYLSVLPMIAGNPNPALTGLQSALNQQAVFDPLTGATFSADGNLARTFAASPALMQAIGMRLCQGIGANGSNPPPCINADGTMNHPSALAFIQGLNTMVVGGVTGYLGQIDWQLPPVPTKTDAQGHIVPVCSGWGSGTGCKEITGPMASLFYNQLNLQRGQSVTAPSTAETGNVFTDIQPYLYWSCPSSNDQAANTAATACSPNPQCASVANGGTCGADMEWSFDFGNGFQGTDEAINDLFVTAYFVPEPPGWAIMLAGLSLAAIKVRRRRRSA